MPAQNLKQQAYNSQGQRKEENGIKQESGCKKGYE
jgi:hypothetical protein